MIDRDHDGDGRGERGEPPSDRSAAAAGVRRCREALDERAVFEALVLHGFQAGLSWRTVADRRAAFRAAFAGFDVDRVAVFDDTDLDRAMAESGVIRNRRKFEAAVGNARAVVALRPDGGVVGLVRAHLPVGARAEPVAAEGRTRSVESIALAGALRARGFRFVGAVSVHALLESTGLVVPTRATSARVAPSGADRASVAMRA